MSVPGTQTNFNDDTFYFAPAGAGGGGGGGGVSSIVAGAGITISPAGGQGAVTITNGRSSDAPANSIQLSDGNGGFTSVNTTLISSSGNLSLGVGTISTNGGLLSNYNPAATPPTQPNGAGLRGSFGFNFTCNGGDTSLTEITPLMFLTTNGGGRIFAVNMSTPGSDGSNAMALFICNGLNSPILVSSQASTDFFFQVIQGVIKIVGKPGSSTGVNNFVVTILV